MNIRKILFFAAAIANNARNVQSTLPDVVTVGLDRSTTETPLLRPVENTGDNERCHDPINAPIVVNSKERLKLLSTTMDNLIVSSDGFKKSKNSTVKTNTVKQLMEEVLTADIVFCKLQTIIQLTKQKEPFWIDFKIRLLTQKEFLAEGGRPEWKSMDDVAPTGLAKTTYIVKHNGILMNMAHWDDFGKMSDEEKQVLFVMIKDDLIHELHHAFIKIQNLQPAFDYQTTLSNKQKSDFLMKQSMHVDELGSAPYRTKKERDELLNAFKASEKNIEDLQRLIKQCSEGKCSPINNKRVSLFKDATQHYKAYLLINSKSNNTLTDSSLTNLLLQLNKLKEIVTQYPPHKRTLEYDAYCFGMLSLFLKSSSEPENQDLFRYLFSDLLDWHNKRAPEEYRKCMREISATSG